AIAMLLAPLALVKQRAHRSCDTPMHDPDRSRRTADGIVRAMSSLERRVAIEAARAAGHLLREARSGMRRISYKGSPTNLVTEMDARAGALVLDHLQRSFPGDAILAEESGARAGASGRRWIIDPLDGTTNYAHGVPIWAVSIALEEAAGIALGVVFDS